MPPPATPARSRPAGDARRRWPAALLGGWLLLSVCPVAATRAAENPLPEPITDPTQVWGLPTESKALTHPLRVEGRVDYYDPMWGLFWLERNGVSTYMQLSATPPVMRTGQYVVIEGSIIPAKGLAADLAKVTVLRDYAPIDALDANGRIRDMSSLGGRIVTANAYVDGEQLIDADHFRLALIIDERPVIGWVKPDDLRALPSWQGRFVRVVGLYSGRFDPTGTETTVELWIGRQADVAVLGSIATDPDFELPTTPINELYRMTPTRKVHIRGQVQSHDLGHSLFVRDETGQVVVSSVQKQRMSVGADVEAVGLVAESGAQWILRSALYRLRPAPRRTEHAAAAALETADQVRHLTLAEAARGRPVSITGLVTWSLPGTDFFFLQDLSGGIRVRYSSAQMETPKLQQALTIEGVTGVEAYDPAVELKAYRDAGSMTAPPPNRVSYARAITGAEDGQWVELRGFFQRAEADGDHCRIYVMTPIGEFVARLESPINFSANPGTIIRVSGVAETQVDSDGRVTGLTLLVPFLHSITVEQEAPRDLYDLPLSPIKELPQLSVTQDLLRVRVSGVVQQVEPGELVYLDDGNAGLLVLSHDQTRLEPGDSIEAVGTLGREGARTILREAAYRKVGTSPVPPAVRLGNPERLSMVFDSRLVRVRGTLIDALTRPEGARLTLQAGSTLFEAVLDHHSGDALAGRLTPGAVLELTGIYRIVFDDARQPRAFQLRLRTAQDIAVVQPARFWTAERALGVAAVLAGCVLLGVGWIAALRRRVARQTAQIRAQLERQAQLEAEVHRAARLESLGVLAGGIAHDFNNLLTVVIGNLSLAMLDAKVAAGAGNYLRDIERAAYRARDLTQQLLTFARGGEPLRTTVAVPETVRAAVEAVAPGRAVQVEYDVPPDLWSATVDRDQVAQALRNILANAIEAMPHGGVVRIALRNDEVAPGAAIPLAAGRYVRLMIADTGVGISPEILPRIFDPYFSTKKAGGGLGLATVYSIIKRHHGYIEARSAPGQGATFTLWLPATETVPSVPPLPAGVKPAPARAPSAPVRVLLMDDEESIRILGKRLLERMRLDTTVVADGAAALREFSNARESGRPFDLLILDLTIQGGMGGKETIAAVRSIDLNVPAIVSSGYSNDPVRAEYKNYGFQAMVPKPYEVAALSGTIEKLLARPQPGAA